DVCSSDLRPRGVGPPVDDPPPERVPLQRPAMAPAAAAGRHRSSALARCPDRLDRPGRHRGRGRDGPRRRHFESSALELSGPDPLTPGEQVATLAEVLRRPLRYDSLTDPDAPLALAGDTPPDLMDAFFRFFSDGEFDDSRVVDTVLAVTGRRPRTFRQWVHQHAEELR